MDDPWGEAAFKPDTTDKKLPGIILRTNRLVVVDPAEKQQLSTTDVFVRTLKIKAERKNKGLIFIGSNVSVDLRVNGYPLDAGEEMPLSVNNLALVFFQGDKTDDAIRIIFES